MSLENPNFFERVKAWPYLRITLVIGGLVVLLGSVLFVVDRCSTYRDEKETEKRKQAINANVAEIANITNQIANLELKREGLKQGVNRDMQDLHEKVFGREEIKKEANQALANYHKAVNANSNVDRTAEDLERILRELEK